MNTIQPIRIYHRRQAGFTTTTSLALLVALMTGIALMPAAANAAGREAKKQSLYQPPNKLRRDRLKAPEKKVELTAAGKALADKYAAMLDELRAEIEKQLPQIASAKQKALRHALAAQKLAQIVYQNAQRNWRRGYRWPSEKPDVLQKKLQAAPGRLADAKLELKHALAMPDSDALKARTVAMDRTDVQKWQQELEKLPKEVAKAKKSREAAKQREPELTEQVKAAADALQKARANATQAYKALGVDGLLGSDKLDGKLAKFMVISQETPYWLAAYAQQGPEKEQIVEQLLGDKPLMIRMLVADGPVWQKYGRAAEIYQDIQKVSPRARSKGLFQRLALAVALAHAVPVRLEMPKADGGTSHYADPVKRYRSYEKAYLDKKLDPAFAGFTTWDLRMVVNGTEPDYIDTWARKMLHNYRPDLITMKDYDWRYVESVVTEVNYTSKFQHMGWDRPDLERYQNILATGGVCGRRAWFGRSILRAFGNPTTARSQYGHAALVHWTPDGWVANLGGGWGAGNNPTFLSRYPTDLDFLASTQARQDPQAFMKVKRAQWIGCVYGEDSVFGYHINIRGRDYHKRAKMSVDEVKVPGFWHSVALIKQNMIIENLKAQTHAAVGEDLGESDDDSTSASGPKKVEIPASQRKITIDKTGTIHIPAAACSKPTNNTKDILFMPSDLGGWQLHYARRSHGATFEYTFDAPKAGKYQLTARLVTPAPKQHLYLKLNSASKPIDIALPYTIGMWEKSKPVEIELTKGKNVLTFSHAQYFQRGLTIRDFTLAPVK